jgi:hypothetical protein
VLRLLCLSAAEPAWLPLTLQLQASGCSSQQLRWVSSPGEALGLTREEGFDCLLVAAHETRDDLSVRSLVAFLQALRAGGHDEGSLLVAAGLSDAEWADLLQVDCEVVVTSRSWECPVVVPAILRAARRARLVRENNRLANVQRRNLLRERDEAVQLITQQWRMIEELQTLSSSVVGADAGHEAVMSSGDRLDAARPPGVADRVPPDVRPYYHELLRIYVIMGSGSLGTEIAGLADRLAAAELTPREVLELHLERVESLVGKLGRRSARHVLARADLLALEVMMHLGECYQRRTSDDMPPLRFPRAAGVQMVDAGQAA